ncbi:MAG: MATE family efflux transporter [Proteobacteria bacterium]|nr:MATE family efflux transporter [Pseudomonadota bacterium]
MDQKITLTKHNVVGRQVVIAEVRQLVRLAAPLVFTQLAQMGMGVVDTVMAGRLGAVNLAGVALGGVVFWPLLLLVAGVVMSLTPTVSQLHGSGRSHEAGEAVRQVLWIALVAGALLVLVLRNIAPLYYFVGVDPQAIPITLGYLSAISWGVLPVLGYFALRYLCEGLSWTTPAMVISGVGLLLKIPLNYWFIYGGWGLPAMGGVGCGWASAVVMGFQFVAICLVVKYSRVAVAGAFAKFSWPQIAAITRYIKLGLPIGMSTFVEFGIFSLVTLLIGRLGAETVAAHQIVNNISGLVFMVPVGLGMATSIRVGFNVGANDLVAARRSGWVAIGASFGFALVAVAALLPIGPWVVGLYSSEPRVVAVATSLLIIVALYQIFDDVQVIAMGALRGYKDTAAPFFIAFACYWLVSFPVALVLGYGYFESLNMGVAGYWVGLASGLVCAALVLVSRFNRVSKRFAQQSKRVQAHTS